MTDQYQNIKAKVARIQRYQESRGISDAKLIDQWWKYLGSAKTWRERLVAGKFEELGKKFPEWERKLDAMVAELDGRSPVTDYFEELPLAKELKRLFDRLQEQKTDRRCGVLLAPTGTGKSTSAHWIVTKYPRESVYVRANEAWRDSKSEIILGIARAIGLNLESILRTAARLGKLIESLKLNPQTVLIDEAHEGGVLLMKIVKTLIDETSSKFILLAYPTTWRRMMTATDDARVEAQQLFGRTLKPVYDRYRTGVDRDTVAIFLRKAGIDDDDANGIAAKLLPMVRNNGNLRVLADAVEEAQFESDATDKSLDGEMIFAHLAAMCPVSALVEKGGK